MKTFIHLNEKKERIIDAVFDGTFYRFIGEPKTEGISFWRSPIRYARNRVVVKLNRYKGKISATLKKISVMMYVVIFVGAVAAQHLLWQFNNVLSTMIFNVFNYVVGMVSNVYVMWILLAVIVVIVGNYFRCIFTIRITHTQNVQINLIENHFSRGISDEEIDEMASNFNDLDVPGKVEKNQKMEANTTAEDYELIPTEAEMAADEDYELL